MTKKKPRAEPAPEAALAPPVKIHGLRQAGTREITDANGMLAHVHLFHVVDEEGQILVEWTTAGAVPVVLMSLPIPARSTSNLVMPSGVRRPSA